MSGDRSEKAGDPGSLALLGQDARAKPRRSREATLDEKFLAKKQAWERCGGAVATTHDVYLGDARMMRDASVGPAACRAGSGASDSGEGEFMFLLALLVRF